MNDENLQEVYYDRYCKTCKHKKLPEEADPCDECLSNPVNYATLFENAWPDVGAPIEKNINKLKAEQADGAKVILWTNCVGGALDKAVNFCKEHGIHLDAVNENLPEIVQGFGTDCRKIFANEYWDDHAVWMSKQDIGEFSDGFHTFNSLYHQRLILFAALVNTFPSLAWKSRKHSDGEVPFGGGWFIVGVDTPKGPYTYHYEDKDWDLFHCREIETASVLALSTRCIQSRFRTSRRTRSSRSSSKSF